MVDDDPIATKLLLKGIATIGHTVVAAAKNYSEALLLAQVPNEQPDVFLIDIHLNDVKDGIELAHEIRKQYAIPCILVTGNADSGTIGRIIEDGFLHILVKPVKNDELRAIVEIAVAHKEDLAHQKSTTEQHLRVIKDCIFIKEGADLIKVKYSEIKFLMSSHIYVHVVTIAKEFIVRTSLTEYINHFDPMLFMRTHRSYAVNVEFIEKITSTEVWVEGKSLPLAKQYREELLSRINR